MGTLGLTSSYRMVQFTGKYTRVSEENYNEFLKALGVNFVLRKAATSSTPVMEISESDGNWVMKTSTTMKAIKKGEKDVKAVREFFDDKLIMTMTVDDVTSTKSTSGNKCANGPQHVPLATPTYSYLT